MLRAATGLGESAITVKLTLSLGPRSLLLEFRAFSGGVLTATRRVLPEPNTQTGTAAAWRDPHVDKWAGRVTTGESRPPARAGRLAEVGEKERDLAGGGLG